MSDRSPNAVIQRLFLHAERRLGGAAALAAQLEVEPEALAPYLAGTAIPPTDMLLCTLSLVLDDLDEVIRGHRDLVWRTLLSSYGASRRS